MASIKECREMVRGIMASDAPLTPMLWGVPGIGKTSSVEQAAKELGVPCKAVIAHLYQPIDVLGLPFIVDGRCAYAPPTVFPDVERDGPAGVFFIDELPNCVPAMQSAWGVIILERSTKHYKFPPGWRIVCAGNNETDRAGSARLITSLENRLLHITVHPAKEEFLNHAIARGFHPAVTSFLEERTDALIKFDASSPDRAFPSPRSWERVSDILKLTVPAGPQGEMVKGAIGQGMAVEFEAFRRIFSELPRLADVLSGAADMSKVTRMDILRATIYSVLAHVGEKHEATRFEQAARLALRLPNEWSILLTRRLYELSPNGLMTTPAWTELSPRFLPYVAATK